MPRRRQVVPADLLGPTEAQVMDALWRHPRIGGMEAARLVNEARGDADSLSFRTILTILTRLERKGYVDHVTEGKRTFLYSASMPQDEFVQWHAEQEVRKLLQRYGGDMTIAGLVNAADGDPELAKRLEQLSEN